MEESQDNLLQRIQKKIFEINSWVSSYKELGERVEEVKREEAGLEYSIEMNSKAQAVIQILFERLNEKGIAKLDSLLTMGLNQTFPDRAYEVVHDVVQERGSNSLNFILKEKINETRVISSNIRNSTGGSIRAIVGIISTLFYIIKMNGKRVLVVDEGLSQVDDSVVENMFSMLKSFGKEAGFVFVVITHDTRFTEYADKIYWIENGGSKRIGGSHG